MDFLTERLIARAIRYWAADRAPPLTLISRLIECGVDVETLERKHAA